MNRFLTTLAVVLLAGCPNPVPTPDGGEDSGINVDPKDACSGGCAVNQVCDTAARICRDACGGCDGGICQKTGTTFECITPAVTCNGTTCGAGEIACLGGVCSCLGPARGTFDSCFGNVLTPGGGSLCSGGTACLAPKKFQQCKVDGEPCAAGLSCNPVFGDTQAVCTKTCVNDTACDRGEICSGDGCLPSGLFNGLECAIQVDGGFTDAGVAILLAQTQTVGSRCQQKTGMGAFNETEPTGTCVYSFFYFADQGPYPFTTCRPPGGVIENGECQTDAMGLTQQALACSTALECAGFRGANKGLCLKTCNALSPSMTYPSPQPACGATEACVNLYRREDIGHDGALLGVCTKKCNVFDTMSNQCPMYGAVPSVCVPTNPDGRVIVSTDGSGVCVPQRETIAQLGAPCADSDPFKGATCGAGQVCAPGSATSAAVCTQVCDTSCAVANPPARCASEPNANCPSGKTCKTVTATTGARVGYCQ